MCTITKSLKDIKRRIEGNFFPRRKVYSFFEHFCINKWFETRRWRPTDYKSLTAISVSRVVKRWSREKNVKRTTTTISKEEKDRCRKDDLQFPDFISAFHPYHHQHPFLPPSLSLSLRASYGKWKKKVGEKKKVLWCAVFFFCALGDAYFFMHSRRNKKCISTKKSVTSNATRLHRRLKQKKSTTNARSFHFYGIFFFSEKKAIM